MDRDTALDIYKELEAASYPWEGKEYPIHNVRLDAQTNADEERQFRIRVTVTNGVDDEGARDSLVELCRLADVHDTKFIFQNNGIELA